MKHTGIELIKALSCAFGPSGCEDAVRELIIEQIEGSCDGYCVDKSGNLIAKIRGRGMDYDPADPRRVMLAAHMDEVGLMVTEITEDGYLRFGTIGAVDPRVLCGRHVLLGNETQAKGARAVPGIVASKAIHLQSADERSKATPVRKMYIDIGAKDAEDARRLLSVGDVGVFASDFCTYGKDGSFIKGKALDDRTGCALLIEVMRSLWENPTDMPFDLYFAFTTCEEVGISGAGVAAFTIAPEAAIVLEATAVNDLPGTTGATRVATLGEGGVLTLVDQGTVYDVGFVEFARRTAETAGIPCQLKQSATSKTDAAPIQRSLDGVRVLGLSLPARYIHSASNVVMYKDYESSRDLVLAMLRAWQLI